METSKRLTKSDTDKRIWGVCGGLAEYFQVDPTLVRILFVVLTLAGGPGLILYIILGLVMPDAPEYGDYYVEEKPKKQKHDGM